MYDVMKGFGRMARIYEDPELYDAYYHRGDDRDRDEPRDWVKEADNWA